MTLKPVLSVVAATRRRPAALGRLLAALARQTLPQDSFTVTIVNDGSHDEAYARVLREHPSVRYLSCPRQAGPAAARNRGAAAATADWLVFTDDDCLPPPDWLERFRSCGDGADVVGGRVEFAPGRPLGAVGRYLRDIEFIQPLRSSDGSVLCLPSANLAVRREWFERVEGFDVRFPHAGGEDMDLTYRLVKAGARAGIADDWVTHHESPGGLPDLCGRYFRYGRGETMFRRLRADAGLPPQAPYSRRLKAILGLAGKAARARSEQDLAFRLLTVTRQVSYEMGRIFGRWRRP